MPIQPFNSVGGFSVGTGNSLVIDRNAGATFNSLYVTNGATFNSSASFVRGLTTQSLYVSQGATFASTVKIDAGLDAHSISVSQGATFNSRATFVAGLTSLGTVAAQSLSVDQGATFTSQARFVAGLSSGGTVAVQSFAVDSGATFASRARFVAGLSSGGTVAVHSLSVDQGATFSSTATFTPQARFVAGLSSGGTVAVQSLSVDQGATFASRATFSAGLTSLGTVVAQSLSVDAGATFAAQARFNVGLSSGGTVAVQSLSVDAGATFNTVNATTYQNLPVAGYDGATGVASFASHGFLVENGKADILITVTGSGDLSTAHGARVPIITGVGVGMHPEARGQRFSYYTVDDTKIGKTGDSALQTYVFGDFTVFGDGIGKTFGHRKYTFAVDPKMGSVLVFGGHTTQLQDGTTGHTSTPRIALIDARNEFNENNIYTGVVTGLTAPKNWEDAANKWYVDSKFVGGVTFTNISVVGITATNLLVDGSATFGSTVSVAGTLTAHSLFVSNGATFGTVSATTYRNLPQASNSVTGVASFRQDQFEVSSTGHVALTGSDIYFDKDLTAAFGANRTFGKYRNGDKIPAKGKTAREVIELAMFDVLPPSVTLSSNVVAAGITFGSLTPNITLTLDYTINTLGATAFRAELYARRPSSISHDIPSLVYTQENLASESKPFVYVHTALNGGYTTIPSLPSTPPRFDYYYVVTDSLGGTAASSILSITAAAYVAPTITFSITGPSAFTSPTGQEVTTGLAQERMLGNRVSRLYARLTRQSPLIDITGLGWQYGETSGTGSWTPTFNLVDGVTFAANSASTPDISHTGHTASAGTTFGSTIKFGRYRIRYTDLYKIEGGVGSNAPGTLASGNNPQINFEPVIYYGKTTLEIGSVDDIVNDISAAKGTTTNRKSFFTNSFTQLVSTNGEVELNFPPSTITEKLAVIIPADVATNAKFTESNNSTITPTSGDVFTAQNEYGATAQYKCFFVGESNSAATIKMKNA